MSGDDDSGGLSQQRGELQGVVKKLSERTLKREIVSRFAHGLLDVLRCGWTLRQDVLTEALGRGLVKEKMDALINNNSAAQFFILWGASIT